MRKKTSLRDEAVTERKSTEQKSTEPKKMERKNAAARAEEGREAGAEMALPKAQKIPKAPKAQETKETPARRPRRRRSAAEKTASKGPKEPKEPQEKPRKEARPPAPALVSVPVPDSAPAPLQTPPDRRESVAAAPSHEEKKGQNRPASAKRRTQNRNEKDAVKKETEKKDVAPERPLNPSSPSNLFNIRSKNKTDMVKDTLKSDLPGDKANKNNTGNKNKTSGLISGGDKHKTDIENISIKEGKSDSKKQKTITDNKKASDKSRGNSKKQAENNTGSKKISVKTHETPPRESDVFGEVKAAAVDNGPENNSGLKNKSVDPTPRPSKRPRRGGRNASRRKEGMDNIPDITETADQKGKLIDTGSISAAIEKTDHPAKVMPALPAAAAALPEVKPEPESEPARRGRRKKNPYSPLEYGSVQLMSSLRGFAPLGMLFVLMDILKGREEGLIHINQLAQSLSIGKPSLLAQLENLEAAGLIRTLSSSRMGRHVELLAPNQVRSMNQEPEEVPLFSGALPVPLGGGGEGEGKEAGGQFSVAKLEGLARYLQRRGVEIVSIPDETDLDPRVSQIAAFLGKYLSYILPFYETLKATLNEGSEFTYSLAGLNGRDVTHTLNFCRMLQEVGFLASYAYRRAPHCKIVARVNRTPTAINFLTGGWLEHYIRDKVVSILTTHPATLDLPYAFMKNPRIILPGEEDFELDLLLSVGERIFWIEAKTGEYLDFLPKYSRVSKVLGLNRNTSMLVSVGELAPGDNLSARYELSCCNLDEFADVFRINLVRELQQGSIRRRRG